MCAGAVERLNEAIATVCDVDIETLGDDDLDELVTGLQRARHRLAGATADSLARWDAVGVWRGDGSRSATSRLARDAATSTTTAHIELRRARALRQMPATAAAERAGRVSPDHVDVLGRADQPHGHHLFARDEEVLVDECNREGGSGSGWRRAYFAVGALDPIGHRLDRLGVAELGAPRRLSRVGSCSLNIPSTARRRISSSSLRSLKYLGIARL